MKKLLTLAALLGAASVSFGQGAVSFANGVATTTHITFGPSGQPATNRISGAAGSYYFGLFYGPSTLTLTSLDPTLSGFSYLALGTNTGSIGRINGDTSTDKTALPAGYAVGSTAGIVVVGWDSSLGASWSQAQAWWLNGNPTGATGPSSAYIGRSTLAEIQLGGGLTPIVTVFGSGVGQIPGFNLNLTIAPEPSTFALAGLGAASLLIFRRRK